jgi:hypothetical protein
MHRLAAIAVSDNLRCRVETGQLMLRFLIGSPLLLLAAAIPLRAEPVVDEGGNLPDLKPLLEELLRHDRGCCPSGASLNPEVWPHGFIPAKSVPARLWISMNMLAPSFRLASVTTLSSRSHARSAVRRHTRFALMLAYGFTHDLIAGVVLAGLATVVPDMARIGEQTIDVELVMITDAGRRVLDGLTARAPSPRPPYAR